jgi:hypothetical protein
MRLNSLTRPRRSRRAVTRRRRGGGHAFGRKRDQMRPRTDYTARRTPPRSHARSAGEPLAPMARFAPTSSDARLCDPTLYPASLGLGSGDRFGASRGGSGSFKTPVVRAEKPADCRESALPSAFPRSHSSGRILHGKEGVDGSSPSEGSRESKVPANRPVLLSESAPRSTS